jgi:hypothetical protein
MNTYDIFSPRRTQSRRSVLGVAAMLFATCACVIFGLGAAADAHGKTGKISLADAVRNEDGTITFVVEVLFDSDNDPAPDASVTIVAEQVDALKVGPVKMAPVSGSVGKYSATVALSPPGKWQLRFTSLTPEAYFETAFDVEANASAPETPATVDAPSTPDAPTTVDTRASTQVENTTTPAAPSTALPASLPTTTRPLTDARPTCDSSSNLPRNVGIAAGLLGVLGLGFWFVRRRQP